MYNGKFFEDKAEEYLRLNGYTILHRNWHSRWGEIDIIAKGDGCTVFVEVKGYRYGAMVTGVEQVTLAKQKKIIMTARYYMAGNRNGNYRFDVLDIMYTNECLLFTHIKNAFTLDNS